MNALGLALELLSPLLRVAIHSCQDHCVLTSLLRLFPLQPDQSIVHCSQQSNK